MTKQLLFCFLSLLCLVRQNEAIYNSHFRIALPGRTTKFKIKDQWLGVNKDDRTTINMIPRATISGHHRSTTTEAPWATIKEHHRSTTTEAPWATIKEHHRSTTTEAPWATTKEHHRSTTTEAPWATTKEHYRSTTTETPWTTTEEHHSKTTTETPWTTESEVYTTTTTEEPKTTTTKKPYPTPIPENRTLYYVETMDKKNKCILLTADIIVDIKYKTDKNNTETAAFAINEALVNGSCNHEHQIMQLFWYPNKNIPKALEMTMKFSHKEKNEFIQLNQFLLNLNTEVIPGIMPSKIHHVIFNATSIDYNVTKNHTYSCASDTTIKVKKISEYRLNDEEHSSILAVDIRLSKLKFEAFRLSNNTEFSNDVYECLADKGSINVAAAVCVPLVILLIIILGVAGFIYYRRRHRETAGYQGFL